MSSDISERYRVIIEERLRKDPAAFQGNNGHNFIYWMFRDACSDHLPLLIEHGCDINAPDVYDKTLLFYAVQTDNSDAVKALLELGADPYGERYSVGNAAIATSSEALALFLLERAPPRTASEEDMLMLTAIQSGRTGIVRYFLDYGYPPNKKMSGSLTPLYFAAWQSNLEVLRVLVDNGADVNLPSYHGDTPLIKAVAAGEFDAALWLLAHGADPSLCNHNGANAFAMASSSGRKIPAELDKQLAVAMYVPPKAYTALMGAASHGDSERLVKLLQNRPLLEHRDQSGLTALHHACRRGCAACVALLLERGADTNAVTVNKETPLVLALRSYGEIHDCAVLLLSYGADPLRQDNKGLWPSQIAASQGLYETAKLLADSASNKFDRPFWQEHVLASKLVYGVLHNDAVSVEAVVREKQLPAAGFVDIVKQNLVRIFFSAVEYGFEDVTLYLLEGGANVNCADGDGNTPLNIAARYSRISLAKLLIERGADIEAETERGYTPVQFAKTRAMYEFLLGQGAKDGRRVV